MSPPSKAPTKQVSAQKATSAQGPAAKAVKPAKRKSNRRALGRKARRR